MANRHMKRRSTSLITEEMQFKTTMRITSDYSEQSSSKCLQIVNTGEGVEKREPSYTVSGTVNWYNHYRKQYRGSLKNGKQNYHVIQQSILGHSPKNTNSNSKTLIQKDICTPMFIAAQSATAKTWGQPKYLSTYEQIKNMYDIYKHITHTYTYKHTHTQWNITQAIQNEVMHLQQHGWS